MELGNKHRRTLASVFAQPIPAGCLWADIERLFVALVAELSEGRGSRARVALSGIRTVFHRPHPQKETDRGSVRSVRRFLVEAGIQPEDE